MEKIKAIETNEWLVCGNCGGKLAKKNKHDVNVDGISIKCHQCKHINEIKTKEKS